MLVRYRFELLFVFHSILFVINMSYSVQTSSSGTRDALVVCHTSLLDVGTYIHDYGSRFNTLQVSVLPSHSTTLVISLRSGTSNITAGVAQAMETSAQTKYVELSGSY